MHEAKTALEQWDGTGAPPGNWLKYKGYTLNGIEHNMSNPDYEDRDNKEISFIELNFGIKR